MQYDIVIAGGGPSGAVAALAAARAGSKVLLIEKNAFLGGMNTAAMVCPIMTFHSAKHQVVQGIAEEIIKELMAFGGSLGHIPDPLGVTSTITPIEPEILKAVYFSLFSKEPNIELLLHSIIVGAEWEQRVVKSVKVANKNGITGYSAKIFIDATGDGDLAVFCKAEYAQGRLRDEFSQPMTLMFKMGNVNFEEIYRYMESNPEQFILNKNSDIRKYLAVSGFFDLVGRAKAKGELTLPRDRVLFFEGINKGEVFVNMTRVIKRKGTDVWELTLAEEEGSRQVMETIAFMRKYLPGFSNSVLMQVAPLIGVRETRRVVCRYTLSENDITSGAIHEDSVAVCAFPIDIHDPISSNLTWVHQSEPNAYDIPFRTMVVKNFKNLLVTGRCISATHEAMASARISATAMALGQAAGTAAAIQLANDANDFAQMDVKHLQAALKANGAIYSKAQFM
ncbi:MAG: FAD-dependent oxidoreductase [Firmicutes bacterium]|nr:FAD-dependent oxidoreductase [Bacillota bacterium]